MKKQILFFIFVAFLVFFPFHYGFCSASTVFEDDFNSYNDGDLNGQGSWVADTAFDVQGVVVREGLKAVYVEGTSEIFAKKIGADSEDEDGSISFSVKPVEVNGEIIVMLCDFDQHQTAHVWFDSDGNIKILDNVTPVIVQSYELNTWYDLFVEWRFIEHDYRVTVNDGNPSDWLEGVNGTAPYDSNRVWLEIDGRNGLTSAYFDTICEVSDFELSPVFVDVSYSDTSEIGAFQLTYFELSTSTPPLADWGYRITGRNPELFYNLDISLFDSSSTLVSTSTYNLFNDFAGVPDESFMLGTAFDDFCLGNYHFDFQFREQLDNASATSSITTVSFELSTSSSIVLESDWLDHGQVFVEPSFNDIWGLGSLLYDKLNVVFLKFPFSWIIETQTIWKQAVIDYKTATSSPALQISWTLPTSTAIIGGHTFMLLDLKTFSEDFADQVTLFRDLISYVAWLSLFTFVIFRTKSFLVHLRE